MLALSGFDWNTYVREGDFAGLVVCIIMAIIVITALALWHWSKVRIAEAELRLKERMVDRGFSPEEIERVFATGSSKRRGRRHLRSEADAPV
jgi:hypothetical protein